MPQLKLLADLMALAKAGSFVRAAELRHVTHPAFGRRIQALERWAGVPLINRNTIPISLTPQGERLLQTASQVTEQLERTRINIQQDVLGNQSKIRIATGRSLAHTLVADWIVSLNKSKPSLLKQEAKIDIVTGMMAEMASLLEQGKTDFLCCYEHPALSSGLRLSGFQHITLATDKLVPVSKTNRQGTALFNLDNTAKTLPLISYSSGLSMAHIVNDRIQNLPYPLNPFIRCDSLDAALGAVRNGLGIAWLPWSMVIGDCRQEQLILLGSRNEQIAFEVRLYRAKGQLSTLAEAVWQKTLNT